MSDIQKTLVELIQVLDSTGAVKGYEGVYLNVYVGDNADIAKGFSPNRTREELTATQFAELQTDSDARLTSQCKALDSRITSLNEALAQNARDAELAVEALKLTISDLQTQLDAARNENTGLVARIQNAIKTLNP